MRLKKKKHQLEFRAENVIGMREFWQRKSLPGLKKIVGIDVFSLGGLFSHYRPREILIELFFYPSFLKLFIHTHATV